MDNKYSQFLRKQIENMDMQPIIKQIGNREIYSWGADEKGLLMAKCLERHGLHIQGVIDSSLNGNNTEYGVVKSPEEVIYQGNSNKVYILITLMQKNNDILNVLKSNGFEKKDFFYPGQIWNFICEDTEIMDRDWKEEMITRGEYLAENLSKEKFYFLLWGGHIGDEALALSWIWNFKKSKKIPFITIITHKKYEGLVKLYQEDIDDIIFYDKEDLESLRIYSSDRGRITYNIVGSNWRWMPKERKVPFPVTQVMFKTIHLGLDYDVKSKYIRGFGANNKEVQRIIEQENIIKDKSVILIPYAKSAAMLPNEFWKKIAHEYMKLGYQVYTNVAGNEKAVCGTKALTVPLEYIIDIVNYAGHAISIRCGLTDLLALGRCNCQVLYAIDDETEKNYAAVTSLYVNGEESILYKNATYINVNDANSDKVIKNIMMKDIEEN